MKNETVIEIGFEKKINIGNFSNKSYSIKLVGEEEQIKEQFEQKKQVLINYLSELENIVETAHEANQLKNKLNKE